jgi:ribosome production factor 2
MVDQVDRLTHHRFLRVPQSNRLKPKKVKNETRNALGDKVGRIHLGRQDLSSMRVKRVKALRRTRGGEDEEVDADGAGGFGGMDDEGEGVYDSAAEEEEEESSSD